MTKKITIATTTILFFVLLALIPKTVGFERLKIGPSDVEASLRVNYPIHLSVAPPEDVIKNYAYWRIYYTWSPTEWDSFNWLVMKESGWNPEAQNPDSTAYGICQFLNSTYELYGEKTSDYKKQLDMCVEYIKDRYGNPTKAVEFHKIHNWY